MAEAKAAGFNSAVETLRKMLSPQQFEDLIAALPPACAGLVRKPRLATSWLPLAVTLPLFGVAFDTVFERDLQRMFELGRRQFLDDLTGIYKFFVRVASPAFVAGRVGKIYETYLRNGGTMRVVAEGPKSYDLLVEGRPSPNEPFWHYLRGGIHAVTETTKVKNPRVEIVDGGGAQDHCRYRVSWE